MEFESKLASQIANRKRDTHGRGTKVLAAMVVLAAMAAAVTVLPGSRAELILLDEVNIGDPVSEGARVDGWSDKIWSGSSGWGGFDQTNDPYPHDASYSRAHNLRTVWAADEDETQNWASVTLTASTQARLLQISVLDGIGDDSFIVYINGKPVLPYTSDVSTSEYWVLHDVPVKDAGTLVVKIVATGDAWTFPGGSPGKTVYGQLAVNFLRLYGVGGFDMYGYNYDSRLFVGTYDGVDRYLDGLCWGDNTGEYADDILVMKWSAGWDDARFHGGTWGPDAWETNHAVGDYPGDDGQMHHYTYFCKIVWIGPAPVGEPDPYLDIRIWGQFGIVEEVWNDPYGGLHGLYSKSDPGPGFGSTENFL